MDTGFTNSSFCGKVALARMDVVFTFIPRDLRRILGRSVNAEGWTGIPEGLKVV
jgi:hypothetical protein